MQRMSGYLKVLLFILFLVSTTSKNILAQDSYIDSLKTLIETQKADTNKVNTLNELSYEFTNIGEYQIALNYASQAKSLSEKLNFKKGLADAYTKIGLIYKDQSNYPEALKNYFAALKIDEEAGNKSGVAYAYNNIGIIYKNQDNYKEALKMHFASLKIKEELGDKKGIAVSYNNIGILYSIQAKFVEALKNYSLSLKIKEELGDKKGIATSYNNIGNVYLKQGNYQEALKNYFASLKIREESGDKKGIAYSFNCIGSAQLGLKKPIEAKEYAEKALALSKKIGVIEEIKESYYILSKVDSVLGNHKLAYENYKLFIVYRDSIINEENTLKTLQTSIQYEYDKKATADSVKNADEQKVKDAQIKAQTAQIKQEQTQRYGLYGGLSLVLIFSGFLYNRFRVTRKQKEIIEQQNKEVEKQRELADNRRILAEEQKEIITKKNQEIIDSIHYAQRIQKSLLPTEKFIERKMNELKK